MGCVATPGAVLRTRIAASCLGSGYRVFASKPAPTWVSCVLETVDQNAKHEQPNAPQNPWKSLTGAFDRRARSWPWACTVQGPLH